MNVISDNEDQWSLRIFDKEMIGQNEKMQRRIIRFAC